MNRQVAVKKYKFCGRPDWQPGRRNPQDLGVFQSFLQCILGTVVILLLCSVSFAAIRVDKVEAGLDGYVRGERWVPVVFYLRNFGENFQGKLEVLRGETVFRKSVDLGAATSKKIEVIIYVTNNYEPLTYRILDPENHIEAQGRLDTRLLNFRDNLILVVSNGEYNHQFLNGVENPWSGKTFVIYRKPGELYSESIAYSSADTVAIGDLSPEELPPGRWKALTQYVASGGVLVCSPASALSVLQNPLLRENLPFFSAELNQISKGDFLVSKWSSRSSEPFPDISIPAQTLIAGPADRELIPLNTRYCLVANSPYYKGNIIYFAFDYTRLPESMRGVFANFWNELVFPSAATNPPLFTLPFRQRLEENPTVQKFLYDIPGLRLPKTEWFALFFFVYICAIGPFQFFLLKVLKKNSLLWITFPAIILFFSVVSFGYSKYRHTSERKITQVSVIEIFPRLNQQSTFQVYGTAISESGTFDFQAVPENSYLRKFVMQSFTYQPEPYTFSEDLPYTLVGENMKKWTFRTFDAISVEPISLPVRVTVEAEGNKLKGRITNAGNFELAKAFFFYDSRNAVSLETILPDTSRSFSLELNSTSTVPFAEPHLRDLLHLYSASRATPHFFFAKIPDSKGEIMINGKSKSTVCEKYIAVYVDVKSNAPVNPWISTNIYPKR